jgi:hypothetical protein
MNRIEKAAGLQDGSIERLQAELPMTPVSCAAAAANVATHVGAAAFGRAAGWAVGFIAATAAAYGAGVAAGYVETRDDLLGQAAGVQGGPSAEALLQARADLLAA